jgi:hypothetical protein
VGDDRERARLQQAAVTQKWTVARLRVEIRRLQGGQSGDPLVEVARLDDATAAWLVTFQEAWTGEDGVLRDLENCLRGEDGHALRERLRALERALDELHQRAGDVAARLRSLPTGRSRR